MVARFTAAWRRHGAGGLAGGRRRLSGDPGGKHERQRYRLAEIMTRRSRSAPVGRLPKCHDRFVMNAAEALVQARPLVDDLIATLGWDQASADDAVLGYLTAPTSEEEDPWWLYHLVEAMQEQVHEHGIDTAWPRCPRHGGHPLWLEEIRGPELWWSCRTDGDRVAPLGRLSAMHVRQSK